MRKLIKVINSKILRKKKEDGKNDATLDKKQLNFPFRRDKLAQRITFRSFEGYQEYFSECILATSNFQGNQFVIKHNYDQENLDENKRIKNNQNRLFQKPFSQKQIPDQVQERFFSTIKEINHIIEELFVHKKQLLEQTPFEKNIILALVILAVCLIILILFTLIKRPSQNEQNSTLNHIDFSSIFLMLFISLILIGLVNLGFSIFRPYNFFNFDYEVIEKVSQRLFQQNKKFFNDKKYTLKCDIQLTWILLKPLQSQHSINPSNQVQQT